MNHKRKRPKNRRGGCLMCKFWKVNGSKLSERTRPGIRRNIVSDSDFWLAANETSLAFWDNEMDAEYDRL